MIHKSINDLPSFLAGDKTNLIEVLHPKNDNIKLDYSLAHASLEVGTSSLPHILKECSEVYYFLKGKAKVVIGEEEQLVKAGDTIYIPAGAVQYVENQGDTDLCFYCIVTPPWSFSKLQANTYLCTRRT